MKTKSVYFSRLVSHGNYENTTIGITVESDSEDDLAIDMLNVAKKWVEQKIDEITNPKQQPKKPTELVRAELIWANPSMYTGQQIRDAHEVIERYNPKPLPF